MRYHLEFFKCSESIYRIYKSIRMREKIWEEIVQGLRFIPLLIPKKRGENEDKVQYKDYITM